MGSAICTARAPYLPASANASALAETSEPTIRTCARVAIGISSRTSIARLYGSSPVEQPALQIVNGRFCATERRINSGSTCWRNARICGGFRKKCVS